MDALALRVRDRYLTKIAVQRSYASDVKLAAWAPPQEIVQALVEGFWEPRQGSTDRQAFGGIMRAVGRLLGLLRKAPQAWGALKRGLGLDEMEGLSLREKAKVLGSKLKTLASAGKKALGKALQKLRETFPLSLYFAPKSKAPGLTDLINSILKKSPRMQALLSKIKGGALRVDKWLKKYVPRMSRLLYAAIFIYVWINVAELSWDIEGIIAGFTGAIGLDQLLASLPESGIGLIAAAFGLGYGALPYTIVARIIWLVLNRFISWVPGKGLQVHWSKMDVPERDVLVPV